MDISALDDLVKVLPEILTKVIDANPEVTEITDTAAIQKLDAVITTSASQRIITDEAGNMKAVDITQPVPQGSYSMWAYDSGTDDHAYGKYLSWIRPQGKPVQFWLGLYTSPKETYLALWFSKKPDFSENLEQAGFERKSPGSGGLWYTLSSTEIGKKLQDFFDKAPWSKDILTGALTGLLMDALIEILKKLFGL
jgi:hypothetical protein